jgi:hypothetical protein
VHGVSVKRQFFSGRAVALSKICGEAIQRDAVADFGFCWAVWYSCNHALQLMFSFHTVIPEWP